MKITVTTLSEQVFAMDVSQDLELENFKAYCSVESGIPSQEIVIVLEGRPLLGDAISLKEHGIKDGDIVVLQHHRQQTTSSKQEQRSSDQHRPEAIAHHDVDPAHLRDILMKNPYQLNEFKEHSPALADALISGDFETFSTMLAEERRAHKEKVAHQRLLSSDSLDVEAQRLIAEEIHQKNIDANMAAAMEYNPESFGTVCMLYVDCFVNGYPVKAFIDSGAQTTIMSTACADRCNITRLIDTRFSGTAKGVGTQAIIGRIHMVQIEIAKGFFTTSFCILANQKMDMLLGLDMLKRHQCVIDLKRGCLQIGTTQAETPFLAEADLPKSKSALLKKSHDNSHHDLQEDEDHALVQAVQESVKDNRMSGSRVNSNSNKPVQGPSYKNTSAAAPNPSGHYHRSNRRDRR